MENKIDFSIPGEVVTAALASVNGVAASLKPYIISLSKDERKKLAKMGDGTSPFVQKTLEYSQSNPEFAPAYFKTDQFANDFAVWSQLNTIFRPIQQLFSNLDDTTIEAGSESYAWALTYYNSVKQAAKDGIPGAKPIYEDLKKRFAHTNNASNDSTESQS